MKFEDFKNMPQEAKDTLKGIVRTVGMTAAGIGAGVAANAAEQPNTLNNGLLDSDKEIHAEAEIQEVALDGGSMDFMAAEKEAKEKEFEQLMDTYRHAEEQLQIIQENIKGFENEFLISLAHTRAYFETQNGHNYKQAEKSLDQFDPQEFLGDMQENLIKFITYYQGKGMSFDEMKLGDIAIAMRMKAIEPGNENAALLHVAIADKNLGEIIDQGGKTERDHLQNPAKIMQPLIIELVKARDLLAEAQAGLDNFQTQNPVFASK